MDIRNFFFSNRSYTPIPLALLIIYFAQPSWPMSLVGFIILMAGEAIRLNAVRYAGGATRTTKVGAPSLCTAGPYARVRNPLYVGNMIMYTGIVLIAGAPNVWGMLFLTWVFFTIQYSLIVNLEEEKLVELFGEAYEAYRQFVPALIPRVIPWKNNDTRTPASWEKTFKTEKRTLQNITLIILIIWVRSLF